MPRKKTPLGAIRAKCLECSGGDKQEVQACELRHCPLFPYRLGIDPNAPLDLPGTSAPGKPAPGKPRPDTGQGPKDDSLADSHENEQAAQSQQQLTLF